MTTKRVRILSDISITRSPLWGESTTFIGDFHRLRSLDYNKRVSLKLLPLLLSLRNVGKILAHLRAYDVVFTADLRTAELFSLFRTLFRSTSPKHIVLEMTLDEECGTRRWRMKRALQRYMFSSVDRIVVSASEEVRNYAARLNKPEEDFSFVPFHTNITEPRLVAGGDYILSAGRSGRDYGVLAAALEGVGADAVVVSDAQSVEGLKFPANAKIMTDVPVPEYYALLNNCRFVVVPLKTLVRSTGQVVLLDAMATGKPVIATETVGTRDYIQSGVNGILVPPANAEALRAAICSLLERPGLADQIAANAIHSVETHFTLDRYVRSLLKIAEDVTAS